MYLLYILELFIFILSTNEHPTYTYILIFHSRDNYVYENVNGFHITYILYVLQTQQENKLKIQFNVLGKMTFYFGVTRCSAVFQGVYTFDSASVLRSSRPFTVKGFLHSVSPFQGLSREAFAQYITLPCCPSNEAGRNGGRRIVKGKVCVPAFRYPPSAKMRQQSKNKERKSVHVRNVIF